MTDQAVVSSSVPAPSALGAGLRSKISDNHPIWDVVTKLAAPAAVAISAASYLSGYAYRYTLFRTFGFLPGLVEQSVQDTIATGYFALAVTLISLLIFIVVMTSISAVSLFLLSKYSKMYEVIDKAVNHAFRPLLYLNAASVIIVIMLIGILSGCMMGAVEAKLNISALRSGCKISCSYFRVNSGQVTGIIIGQSKEYTIIAGKRSAYLIPTGQIKSVSPVTSDGNWSWTPKH